jgi:hypothetical protein
MSCIAWADDAQVGIPYIRAQTQDYYERLGGGADPDTVWEDSPQIAITRVGVFRSWRLSNLTSSSRVSEPSSSSTRTPT